MPLSSGGTSVLQGRKIVVMRIPASMIDADERDAVLRQPPGHQAALAEPIAAIAIPQLVFLSRQVEGLFRVAQDHPVGFLVQRVGRRKTDSCPSVWPASRWTQQSVSPLQAFLGHAAGRRDVIDREPRGIGVPTGVETLVLLSEESRLGIPPDGFRDGDIWREIALVAGVVTFLQRHDAADRRVHQIARGQVSGGDGVSGRLVAAVVMGEAADDAVLVGLLGHHGQQLADANARYVGGDRVLQRATVLLAGLRLRVECFQL